MEKILTKQTFPQWIEKLKSHTIYAPVKDEGHWSYKILEDAASINLEYPNAVESPKKIIFPQREILFDFGSQENTGVAVNENLPAEQPTVIFGVRPCDAKALTLTDKVFSGDFEDPYYWKRRNAAVLVGLSCNTPPSPNCFCLSVNGSPFSKEGLDVLLTDLGDAYFVEVLTEKGEQLVGAAGNLFSDTTDKAKSEVKKLRTEAEKKITRQVKDPDRIPAKLKEIFDEPFWEDEALGCIRCGICTYLCPTCHCFDINDEVASDSPLKGKRVRTWDNCQFPDFTMHSSGHNPRPDKASRLRQRISHKYNYFVERYNEYQCTGCGRCIGKCPVGIDIIEVLNKVNEYGV
jgi:ferredoxin